MRSFLAAGSDDGSHRGVIGWNWAVWVHIVSEKFDYMGGQRALNP